MDDFKWVGICLSVLFVGVGVTKSVETYMDRASDQKAMELGYEQVWDAEAKQVLWKPITKPPKGPGG
jgi:hypothetical protein